MAEVTVVANLPCLGLDKNEVITVERTEFIDAVIESGKLSEVDPHTHEARPWWACPVCGIERADYEGPGAHLPQCPNCRSVLAPEQWLG